MENRRFDVDIVNIMMSVSFNDAACCASIFSLERSENNLARTPSTGSALDLVVMRRRRKTNLPSETAREVVFKIWMHNTRFDSTNN